MEKSKAFHLRHGRKVNYFDCHRCFLPKNHSYRKDKKSFTKNRAEKGSSPHQLSGEDVFYRVIGLPSAVDDPINTPPHYGRSHKWTKRSIFLDLPYWSSNLIRHNLDVMHIEKNVFDNVFNTVMNVKGKTKDNIKARKDLAIICDRRGLAVDLEETRSVIPKALYCLTKEQRKVICDWLMELRFPDGYASNLGRCVDMRELKVTGFKSHDCHVFMQRLLPIAFRELLPPVIWNTLIELSIFFQTIYAAQLDTNKLKELEEKAIVIVCNLEKNFPPGFFDAMEHLIIHLPYEVLVGGPVQYRWMYSFERYFHNYKPS